MTESELAIDLQDSEQEKFKNFKEKTNRAVIVVEEERLSLLLSFQTAQG